MQQAIEVGHSWLQLVQNLCCFYDIPAQAASLPTTPGTPSSDVATQGHTVLVATAPGTPTTPSYVPLVTPTTLQVSLYPHTCSSVLDSFLFHL
jgi:hypothetical protein